VIHLIDKTRLRFGGEKGEQVQSDRLAMPLAWE
jgi:hypothetical protein